MASFLFDDECFDTEATEARSTDSEETETDGLVMSNLSECQPSILFEEFCLATGEVQRIFENIRSTSHVLSMKLQHSIEVRSQVQKFLTKANFCARVNGAEDCWSHLVVGPMLNFAETLSESDILVLPLQSTQINPESLRPLHLNGKRLNKKVDFGLAIELNDDQVDRMKLLYRMEQNHEMDCTTQESQENQATFSIGPSKSFMLYSRPLFCHIEVKKAYQPVDPLVQLGVWASAVYARWEQVRVLQDLPLQDFPITFGWTTAGHLWHLFMIRRLPDGSRQITADFRIYNTADPHEIYLILATLCELMSWGNKEFRTGFLATVLNLPSTTATSTPAVAPVRISPRRQKKS